jgi:hypothetical protein
MLKGSIALTAGLLLFGALPAAYGQRWEFGAGGAGSFYQSRTVSGPLGSGDAGFKTGGGFYASLGQIGNRYGGELRYTYLFNDMRVKTDRGTTTLGGRSQSVEYNLHYYFRDGESSVRPYLIAGGGVRLFTGINGGPAIQPTMNVAVLTNTTQISPLLTGGAGVRVRLNARLAFRAELRTAFTPSPEDVITPTYGAKLGGWFFNVLPVAGITYEW